MSLLDKALFKDLLVQVAHAEYERLVEYTAQTLRDHLPQVTRVVTRVRRQVQES